MRISRRKRPQKPLIPKYKKNNEIEADELLVLDKAGNSLGNMSKQAALDIASEQELDLVEINPKSNPPVAKFIDFAATYLNECLSTQAEDERKRADTPNM